MNETYFVANEMSSAMDGTLLSDQEDCGKSWIQAAKIAISSLKEYRFEKKYDMSELAEKMAIEHHNITQSHRALVDRIVWERDLSAVQQNARISVMNSLLQTFKSELVDFFN